MFNFTMFKFAFSSPVRPFTRKYPHGTFQLEFKETTVNTRVSEASGKEELSTSMPHSTNPQYFPALPSH